MEPRIYPSESKMTVTPNAWKHLIYFNFGKDGRHGVACWDTRANEWKAVKFEVGEVQKSWLEDAYNLRPTTKVEATEAGGDVPSVDDLINEEVISEFLNEFEGPDPEPKESILARFAETGELSDWASKGLERRARAQDLSSRAYNEAGYRLNWRFDHEDTRTGVRREWDYRDWERCMNMTPPPATDHERTYYERAYQVAYLEISTKMERPIDLSKMPENDPHAAR